MAETATLGKLRSQWQYLYDFYLFYPLDIVSRASLHVKELDDFAFIALSDTSERISYRALSDSAPQRKIAAATHVERTQSFLAKRFIEIVREEYPAESKSDWHIFLEMMLT